MFLPEAVSSYNELAMVIADKASPLSTSKRFNWTAFQEMDGMIQRW